MDNCKKKIHKRFKLPCSNLHNVFKYYEDIRFNDDDDAVADDMRLSCFELQSFLHLNIAGAG